MPQIIFSNLHLAPISDSFSHFNDSKEKFFCIRCDNYVYVTTLRYFQELGKVNGKFKKHFASSFFLSAARKKKNDTDIEKL